MKKLLSTWSLHSNKSIPELASSLTLPFLPSTTLYSETNTSLWISLGQEPPLFRAPSEGTEISITHWKGGCHKKSLDWGDLRDASHMTDWLSYSFPCPVTLT